MLNREDAQKVADKVNAWAHQRIFDFVSTNAHLPPGEFAAKLQERQAAYAAHARQRAAERGRVWDDADDMMVEALLRAGVKLYREIAGRSGRA